MSSLSLAFPPSLTRYPSHSCSLPHLTPFNSFSLSFLLVACLTRRGFSHSPSLLVLPLMQWLSLILFIAGRSLLARSHLLMSLLTSCLSRPLSLSLFSLLVISLTRRFSHLLSVSLSPSRHGCLRHTLVLSIYYRLSLSRVVCHLSCRSHVLCVSHLLSECLSPSLTW